MNLSGALPVAELPKRADDGMPCLELADAERTALRDLAEAALDDNHEQPLDQRLDQLTLLAHEMPVRIRSHLVRFRITGRPYGGLVVANLPVSEALAGPTPADYVHEPVSAEAERATALLLLFGTFLGDPVSFLTQQRGRLVLDLFPIKGHEAEQLGSSSTTPLEWHNEDAFHPLRADWIMLAGIRNHDRVPTTFATVQDIQLDDGVRRLLFEERFVIRPDESHTAAFNSRTTGVDEESWVAEAFRDIADQQSEPRRTAVLYGDREAPYIRIDPAFMPRTLDGEALEALDAAIAAIDAGLRDVVVGPGELLIVDNKRAVHGRRPFAARYDGTDRWLRRINVLADLRRASGRRYAPHGRALV
ncbi:guanitoxin biosynthesis L-enduracididine beta-hydroxylase GntD [Streptomyces sp. NPDC004232]|uniref:guanitoxin biosynthesis L-enduracididine beta-hydroxylase GntD n=1 Tax=Streptomyces sp. NPDC004232 TaxID=3154454 RepID=UPI0033B8F326